MKREPSVPNQARSFPSPLRIVSIGGGTGLSTLLRGLKHYSQMPVPMVDLTAVVTVTDDGGSSGRLRREFDVLPPGDIRNCMVALSEDEALLSRLFQYRFSAGAGLKGHSFGNLFLTAMSHLTGDFAQAVKLSGEVLAISGRIFPSTSRNVQLEALLETGAIVRGETNISRSRAGIQRIRLAPSNCRPLEETLKAIGEADVITLGPGSLFTSVVPNLLVAGVARAIRQSGAVTAYFCNIMTQPGETTGFSASDHVTAIHRHTRGKLIDYLVVNTEPIAPAVRERYEELKSTPVEIDLETLAKNGVQVIPAPLLAPYASDRALVRHDPARTAAVVVELAAEGRRRRLSSGPPKL